MTGVGRRSVLAVSPVAEAGGAETLLLDVLAGLRDAGQAVRLLVLGDGPLAGVARSRGIEVYRGAHLSFRSMPSVVRGVGAVRRAITLARPDVVLASHPKGQLISRLGAISLPGLAHVTHLYDPPSPTSVSTRVAALLPGCRVVITDETAAAYRRLRPRLSPIVIPPGTDAARLRSEAARGDAGRAWADAGLEGPGPRLVTVGRLQRFKGPFDVVAVASIVVRVHPDARFLIIGPDSPIEPGLRVELEAAIAAEGLRASVALAGRLTAEDLAATVAGATLLLHPAHREPFGLAVVEALALGTPVVAYDAPGPASILARGGGVMVPVGDTAAMARQVVRALDDDSTVADWKAGAAPTASRYDIGSRVGRYVEVLEQAASTASVARTASLHTIGVAPAEASGVRDYGRLLEAELERRGFAVVRHWLPGEGDRLSTAFRISARVLTLGLRVPPRTSVLWHYSPVVHGWRGVPGFGVLAGAILRARGCRVVTVLHELAYTYRPGIDPPRARVKAAAQNLALSAVLAGSTHIVVTTDRRAAALRARNPGLESRIRVIPVFPTIPRGVAPDGGIERAGRGAACSFVVGVPGYAGDGVRPDIVLAAARELGDVRIVLLGAPGPASQGGREWSRLASEQGLEDRLEFTGVVDAATLSRRLAECTVVVLPNEEGPSSRKTTLAAALAQGLPVVSLNGYNRWDEVVDAGALVVVPNEGSALASVLVRLRDSPAERAALGAKAAAFAAERMSVEAAADVFVELLAASPRKPQAAEVDREGADEPARSRPARPADPSSQPSSSQGSGATA